MRKLIIGGLLLLIIVFTTSTGHTAQAPATADNFKQDFLSYINSVREQGCKCGSKWMPPAQPLTWNVNLQKAAYGHAKDMNDKRYFSHTSKDGRNMEDRIVLAGYIFNGYKDFNIGENIAYGQQSIKQVMDEWFKSEGHCKNLMNPAFKEVGVVQYNDYWVQDFGGRESFPPDVQKKIQEGQIVLKPGVKTTHHD